MNCVGLLMTSVQYVQNYLTYWLILRSSMSCSEDLLTYIWGNMDPQGLGWEEIEGYNKRCIVMILSGVINKFRIVLN